MSIIMQTERNLHPQFTLYFLVLSFYLKLIGSDRYCLRCCCLKISSSWLLPVIISPSTADLEHVDVDALLFPSSLICCYE